MLPLPWMSSHCKDTQNTGLLGCLVTVPHQGIAGQRPGGGGCEQPPGLGLWNRISPCMPMPVSLPDSFGFSLVAH